MFDGFNCSFCHHVTIRPLRCCELVLYPINLACIAKFTTPFFTIVSQQKSWNTILTCNFFLGKLGRNVNYSGSFEINVRL
jgi:hypothetical protein